MKIPKEIREKIEDRMRLDEEFSTYFRRRVVRRRALLGNG